jgi:hypothetical protein
MNRCPGEKIDSCQLTVYFALSADFRGIVNVAKMERMTWIESVKAWLTWGHLTPVWIALYFGVLLLSLRWSSTILRGPWLFLLRAFFPNWKFFHAVGFVPHLYVRHRGSAQAWSDWHEVYPRRQRRWWHLFHNTDVNLALAEQNLVDHFSSDLNDLPEGADARSLVTYQLVERLVRFDLDRRVGDGAWQGYQFELRMERPHPQGMEVSETMLRSPECVA